MDSFSPLTPNARRLTQNILQRSARVKNQVVGDAIGKDESTISRIMSGEMGLRLADLYGFLDALGLKIVGKEQVCIDRAIYESYKTLATAALVNPEKLNWDEPE